MKLRCDNCGGAINPFEGYATIQRRQMIESGAGNPGHPIDLLTTAAAVWCVHCEPVWP